MRHYVLIPMLQTGNRGFESPDGTAQVLRPKFDVILPAA